VLEGESRSDVRGVAGSQDPIILRAGQMGVVPKGVEHKPRADGEVKLLLSCNKYSPPSLAPLNKPIINPHVPVGGSPCAPP